MTQSEFGKKLAEGTDLPLGVSLGLPAATGLLLPTAAAAPIDLALGAVGLLNFYGSLLQNTDEESAATYGATPLSARDQARIQSALDQAAAQRENDYNIATDIAKKKAALLPDWNRINLSDTDVSQIISNQNAQAQDVMTAQHNAILERNAIQSSQAQQHAAAMAAQTSQAVNGYTTLAQQLNDQAATAAASRVAATAAQNQSIQNQALLNKSLMGSFAAQSATLQGAVANENAKIQAIQQNRDALHAQALALTAMQNIPTMTTVAPQPRQLPPSVRLPPPIHQ